MNIFKAFYEVNCWWHARFTSSEKNRLVFWSWLVSLVWLRQIQVSRFALGARSDPFDRSQDREAHQQPASPVNMTSYDDE
jgi:hypothetical protein